jgi:hypothetical protein
MHSITGEAYQDMFCCIVARPDKKETWEEQARLLVNARTLVKMMKSVS